MFKNVAAQKIAVYAFDSTTGVPKTGDAANLTAYVSKDFGSVTVLGDTSATEMDSTNAKGMYLFDLTQGETNADCAIFTAKSSTANIYIAPQTIYTDPPNYTTLSIDSSGRAKVDVDTIKTNPVVNGGTITFPTTATLASTTNITAGTVTTATNVTNVNSIANNAITAASLAADAGAEIADAVLDRDMSTGTDSGSTTVRTPRQALRFLRNKWGIAAGTLTVTKENDSTTSWTSVVTTDVAAAPVIANDPAGP